MGIFVRMSELNIKKSPNGEALPEVSALVQRLHEHRAVKDKAQQMRTRDERSPLRAEAVS